MADQAGQGDSRERIPRASGCEPEATLPAYGPGNRELCGRLTSDIWYSCCSCSRKYSGCSAWCEISRPPPGLSGGDVLPATARSGFRPRRCAPTRSGLRRQRRAPAPGPLEAPVVATCSGRGPLRASAAAARSGRGPLRASVAALCSGRGAEQNGRPGKRVLYNKTSSRISALPAFHAQ